MYVYIKKDVVSEHVGRHVLMEDGRIGKSLDRMIDR
jgi:hypothetical protein